jgi:hypothetical protein
MDMSANDHVSTVLRYFGLQYIDDELNHAVYGNNFTFSGRTFRAKIFIDPIDGMYHVAFRHRGEMVQYPATFNSESAPVGGTIMEVSCVGYENGILLIEPS